MARYVMGIDGGTESIRCGIYDHAGKSIGSAAAAYETRFPRPGWAEQQPEHWWQALAKAVRGALADAKVSGDQIAALAVDTTCCTVVFLDDKGEALRPALLWMDVRADQEANDIMATGDTALILNSGGKGPLSAEWMIPKALWVARHEPALFAKASTVCEYQDYLNFKLTGNKTASVNNTAIRWHFRNRQGGFAKSLLATLGLEALLAKWPANVIALGEEVGRLSPVAAEHLGLPQGLLVAQGGADAFIAMVGLGVTRPGRIAFITGSSHLHLAMSAVEMHCPGLWGTYADAVIPGLDVMEGGQSSTGSMVNWFRTIVGADWNYDELNATVKTIQPGSDGLIVQDHFQGNRTPYTDAQSRGAILGLSLNHSRAHVYRAMLEGIACGTKLILDTMSAQGLAVDEMTICGGATRSDVWMQIHADVAGIPLKLTQVPDAATLGSAILAASATHEFDSIQEAADAMVKVARIIEPKASATADYAPVYQRYRRVYQATRSIFTA
jgi:FGGY-family pentulose kinase